MTLADYPASAVPWPAAVGWSRLELRSYLEAAADPAIQVLPTRCPPWTVADLTAHLAATFRRFADQVDRARTGNLEPPFGPDQLPAENLRAVREFRGDPVEELGRHAERFLGSVATADEPIGHQRGPILVGLQVMFGLTEQVVHHDDLARACGGGYQPADHIVSALAGMYGAVFGLPARSRHWEGLLQATGRG